jgi:protein-tyrosine phosphatase
MDKIIDNVYLGSSADGLHRKQQLKDAGITAILNVARDLTNVTTSHLDFKMYHVGLMDGGGNHPLLLKGAVEVLTALVDSGETVLVHCHEGKSRSALVVASYLINTTNKFELLDSAEEYLRSLRPRVIINPGLKKLYSNTIF